MSLRLSAGILLLWTCASIAGGAEVSAGDWPMLAHDPGRSGATATEIRPPFERKCYRLFPEEGLMAGVQPVIAAGRVFIGTMRGTLHAMDSDTGKDVWVYRAAGAILHTCAVADGKVVFGDSSGKICAVTVGEGKLAWSVPTDAAVWNAPLIYRGVALVGSRDGSLYAIDMEAGAVKWKGTTGGPLLSSPALDVGKARVYVASEDMHIYAFDLSNGQRLWQSQKLPGVSFRGYHPVVAPDGSVMVTAAPSICLDSFEPVLMGMVKEVFGDFASWRHKKEENDRLREANFKKMAEPGTCEAQLDYIRKRLTAEPVYQTFFVLDPDTGRQKFVTPIVYAESMNGTGAPPVVTADGKVVVKFQALLRSRYEHYSPFLNVGYLDTATGHITPIMDQSRTYGWHDSLLLVHDEQCQLSAAGRVLINTHQDNVNAMDLGTLRGYEQPFCRNIHEPKAGEAMGIWAAILRNQPLPTGKEWLARGTAVYGGGSVIDTAVVVAGDSFYYIPTHEMNAGAAVIAYRMAPGGKADQESPAPTAKLTEQEWAKVQELPWDWDVLGFKRLSHVLDALPGKVPGTVGNPLTDQAKARVRQIPDSELDRFIQEPSVRKSAGHGKLKAMLTAQVAELISQQWQPLIFPPGKHPREAYRIFADPMETLLTLAQAYPHVDVDLQTRIRRYVEQLSLPGGPLEGPVGKRSADPAQGAVRSYYDIAPDKLFRVMDDITRSDVARLYPLWLWASVTNNWSYIEGNWDRLKALVDQPPNKMEEDCHNGYLAGLIAYCRIADHVKDEPSRQKGLRVTRTALRERLTYEFSYSKGGLITEVPVLRSTLARWRHLTPEIGRFLAHYAGPTHRQLMDVYVDYHRPTWFLAWGVETLWRNESPFAFPTMPAEIFAARAWILDEPAEKLGSFLDLPWCKADLFYLQKLVLCLEGR
ncbi:MAG: PQQ-binding-like beta-propeller repeat protein [Planctomycetes bacterium]|nr:PQQ-binding-like beta-propeller repeat protein [Planctomycetota bacterium]